MQKENRQRTNRLACSIAAWGLAVSLLGSTALVWGRYSTTLTNDVAFTVKATSNVSLTSNGETAQTLAPGQGNLPWVKEEGIQTLSLCISNSDAQQTNPAAEAMTVRLRVFVPDAEDSENSGLGNMTMVLRTEVGVEYEAKAEYLSAGTPMYQDADYGAGWVYYFYDTDGEEWTQTLPGGIVSACNVDILLVGEDIDTTNFKLSIDKMDKI